MPVSYEVVVEGVAVRVLVEQVEPGLWKATTVDNPSVQAHGDTCDRAFQKLVRRALYAMDIAS